MFEQKSTRIIAAAVLIAGILIVSIPSLCRTECQLNIILIIWDGTERHVFYELLYAGKLPFVSTLNVYNMTTNREFDVGTATRQQHSIMFTGYLVNVTGIRSNDPSKNEVPPALNEGLTVPKGITIFERIKQLRPEYRIVGATAKPTNVGDLLGFPGGKYWRECVGEEPPPKDERLYYNMNGFDVFDDRDGLISDYEPAMHVAEEYRAGPRYLALAENKPPFLYMFHLADPDHVGHHGNKPEHKYEYGVNSTQYRDAIINCDQLSGEIYNKLAPSNPKIIVTSDHGFGTPEFGHKNNPNTFIATNFQLKRNAYEADVAPTIYQILGIDITQLTPTLYGEPLVHACIDTTPPIISIISPATTHGGINVSLSFTINEPTSWIGYSLDGKANMTISRNTTLTGLSDALHRLVVYATDLYGNKGSSDVIYFTVDTISPNISILAPKNKTYTQANLTLNFIVDESVSWIAYSLDGQENVTITGNVTLTRLSKSSHSLIVYSKDTVGNTGSSERIYFTIAQQSQSFPITLIVASVTLVAIISLGVFVYFKKLKH